MYFAWGKKLLCIESRMCVSKIGHRNAFHTNVSMQCDFSLTSLIMEPISHMLESELFLVTVWPNKILHNLLYETSVLALKCQ